MTEHNTISEILNDRELMELFERTAKENGTTCQKVLSDFIKDYVVSGGHPETVVGKWPWSRKEQ